MQTTRLEIFSDAVIAIAMTIMVLELQIPHGADWSVLQPLIPIFFTYTLSFIYLGIYWNNHHHLLHATDHVDGRIMWANLHLLFWLSLIPFGTGWMAENNFATAPTAVYGAILLMGAVAYYLLTRAILAHCDTNQDLREVMEGSLKDKISIGLYVAALALTFWHPWPALAIYIAVAVMWLVPDPRIERRLSHRDVHSH